MLKLRLVLAERVGFEPTVQCDPYDDLANRSFRPLRHLSPSPLFKGGKNKDLLLSHHTVFTIS